MNRFQITKALLSAVVDEARILSQKSKHLLKPGIVAQAAYVVTNLAWTGNYDNADLDYPDDMDFAKFLAGEAQRILADVMAEPKSV